MPNVLLLEEGTFYQQLYWLCWYFHIGVRKQAGVYIMTLFDWYAGGLNVMIIALCEVIGIAWIYGTADFQSFKNKYRPTIWQWLLKNHKAV